MSSIHGAYPMPPVYRERLALIREAKHDIEAASGDMQRMAFVTRFHDSTSRNDCIDLLEDLHSVIDGYRGFLSYRPEASDFADMLDAHASTLKNAIHEYDAAVQRAEGALKGARLMLDVA